MALNKAKVIEGAQKLAAQGKLKDAVNEYLKVYKKEPQDQTVLNTLGDLYVRLNKLQEGLGYYTKLADVYVSGGFLVRGIAMFKKISKLDPNNPSAIERLAELYTMQGLMTEARAQYLLLAESYLKGKQMPKAVEVMQKLIDLEPDNIKLQTRLADLYLQHGQTKEAAAIYGRLGARKLQRGEGDSGLEWLTKAAALLPADPDILLLQARAQQKAGQTSEAVATLEKIPGVENKPEAAEILVGARLKGGKVAEATTMAEKAFSADPANYKGLLQVAQALAEQDQTDRAWEILSRVAEIALENNDAVLLLGALRPVAASQPESAPINDLLLNAGRQAGDQDACVEALTRTGQAALRVKDFRRAQHMYKELVRMQPDNLDFTQQLQQLESHLVEMPAAVSEAIEDSKAAAAPAAPGAPVGELDEETKAYVEASLTDIDLFSSYGMNDKAIELAEQVVARAPGHSLANEKLLDFYVGSGNDRGVVDLATRLAQLHRDGGNADRAEEVADLAKRYAEKLGIPLPAQAAPPPAAAAAPSPAAPTPAKGPEAPVVQEVDLTAEWGAAQDAEPAAEEAPATFNAAEATQEITFFLRQGMVDEAKAAVYRYESEFPGDPGVAKLRAQVEATPAAKAAPAAPPAQVEEQAVELVLEEQPAPAKQGSGGTMSSEVFFSDMAGSIDQDLADSMDIPEVKPAKGKAKAKAKPPAKAKAEAPRAAPAPPPAEPAPSASALTDIFEEFKDALGEAEEETDDIETHYNLGIAYKEMGLHEEAIGEFQKAAKTAERREAFHHLVQSRILLALCFRDKGMPKIAVRWYEDALKVPGLDEEGVVAIRYDLGEALEETGDLKAALGCFMEVYGSNVDYRNVGERIRQLSASTGS